MTDLPRYWMERENGIRDPELARLQGEARMGLADAVTGRCTVLLAPPGAGKTTDLNRLVERFGERGRCISLGSYGDLSAKIALASGELGRVAPGGLLALDGVDEAAMPTTQLVSLIREVAQQLPDGIRLVLACRTAGWLPGVDRALRTAFDDKVRVLDLLPLTDGDVVAFAYAVGVDGQAFFEAVRTARASELTRYPKELELLLAQLTDPNQLEWPYGRWHTWAANRNDLHPHRLSSQPVRLLNG